MGSALIGALVTAGADRRGCLRVDQLLQRPLGELTDKIGAFREIERGEQFRNGRIIKSHRCDLFGMHLQVHTEHHADGSPKRGPPIPKPHHAKGLIPLLPPQAASINAATTTEPAKGKIGAQWTLHVISGTRGSPRFEHLVLTGTRPALHLVCMLSRRRANSRVAGPESGDGVGVNDRRLRMPPHPIRPPSR